MPRAEFETTIPVFQTLKHFASYTARPFGLALVIIFILI